MNNYYHVLRPLSGDIHHIDNAKWWIDLETGHSLLETRNRLALLMLVVTEVSEYIDGHASKAPDQHLPEWTNWQIELADVAIRLLDMIGAEEALHGPGEMGCIATKGTGTVDLIQALSLAGEASRKERVPLYRKALNTCLGIVCCMAEDQGCDLPAAVEAKRRYNQTRVDHSHEARRAAGGKKQ